MGCTGTRACIKSAPHTKPVERYGKSSSMEPVSRTFLSSQTVHEKSDAGSPTGARTFFHAPACIWYNVSMSGLASLTLRASLKLSRDACELDIGNAELSRSVKERLYTDAGVNVDVRGEVAGSEPVDIRSRRGKKDSGDSKDTVSLGWQAYKHTLICFRYRIVR